MRGAGVAVVLVALAGAAGALALPTTVPSACADGGLDGLAATNYCQFTCIPGTHTFLVTEFGLALPAYISCPGIYRQCLPGAQASPLCIIELPPDSFTAGTGTCKGPTPDGPGTFRSITFPAVCASGLAFGP